jgi:hypothetical protein
VFGPVAQAELQQLILAFKQWYLSGSVLFKFKFIFLSLFLFSFSSASTLVNWDVYSLDVDYTLQIRQLFVEAQSLVHEIWFRWELDQLTCHLCEPAEISQSIDKSSVTLEAIAVCVVCILLVTGRETSHTSFYYLCTARVSARVGQPKPSVVFLFWTSFPLLFSLTKLYFRFSFIFCFFKNFRFVFVPACIFVFQFRFHLFTKWTIVI